jgi:hypothetical protein
MSSGQPYRYNGNGKAYQVNLPGRQALRLVTAGRLRGKLGRGLVKRNCQPNISPAGMRVTPNSHPPNGSELRSKPFRNQSVRIDS